MNNIDLAAELAEQDSSHKQRRKLPVCFSCGKHFWGSKYMTLISVDDNLSRKFHSHCAEELLKDNPTEWSRPLK